MKKIAFLIALSIIAPSLLASSSAPGSISSQNETKQSKEIDSLRERARMGDVDAMHLLAEMVTEMAPRYDEEAEFWLRRAHALGDEKAPRMLAEMLLLKDDKSGFIEAIILLKRIYKPGDSHLARRIGIAYLDHGHIEESIGWLQSSASEGDFDSSVNLSNLYFQTERIKSTDLSTYWACKAISLRNDNSFIVDKLRRRVAFLGAECSPTQSHVTQSKMP